MILSPAELRHILHMNPELSFQEFETTRILKDNIKKFGAAGRIKIHSPLKTGLLVEYTVNGGEYILFRADIDALPIKEENNFEFKSVNNFMHACGHDVHTSILYSFLNRILNSNIDHNILFLFQPGEETGGGAIQFYESGIFKNFKIKNAIALHVTDEYPSGTIASTTGVLFSSSLEVDIEFNGVSSHVAFPEEGKNAFNALRQFMDAVDKIPIGISEPFIFGMGKIFAGEIRNINPGYAKIEGTMRGLSIEKTQSYYERIVNILNGVRSITGVDYKITKGARYPEVVVDPNLFKILSQKLKEDFNFIDCGYKMTGEDFGYLSHIFPSFMFWLGTSTGEKHGLHNPKFLPGDKIINLGEKAFSSILEVLIR